MKCVFCESNEIQSRIIVKNKFAFAFPTNIPITPGHVLICPTRHVAFFDELTNEEIISIMDLRKQLRKSLMKVVGAEGFNYAWNEGVAAGQAINHLHLHIVPRKRGDAGITEYEPRKFLYRPGSRNKSPDEELNEVVKLVQSGLKTGMTSRKRPMKTAKENQTGGHAGLITLLIVVALASVLLVMSLRSSLGPLRTEDGIATTTSQDAIQAAEEAKKLIENNNRVFTP